MHAACGHKGGTPAEDVGEGTVLKWDFARKDFPWSHRPLKEGMVWHCCRVVSCRIVCSNGQLFSLDKAHIQRHGS